MTNIRLCEKVFFLFVGIFSIITCSGQQPDTIDLTLPIDLTKMQNEHRVIPDNSIYLELAGHLNFVSLNYERVFFHAHDFYLTGRAGIGYIPPSINTISLPCLVNGIYQVSDNFLLEMGAGFSLTYNFWPDYYSSGGFNSGTTFHESESFFDPLLTGFLGIRVQKKKGFLFRFGFTPLFELTNDLESRTVYKQTGITNAFLPWVGMSFGYSFH
jgi:hypothetical protein